MLAIQCKLLAERKGQRWDTLEGRVKKSKVSNNIMFLDAEKLGVLAFAASLAT